MHSIKKVLKPHFLRSIVPLTHERAIQFMPRELLVEFKGDQTYVGTGNHMAQSSVSLPLCWSNTDYDNSAPRDPNLSHLNRCDAHLRGGGLMGDKE